jgi:4-cresol dehydrogenase (hydroxylating)
MRAAISHQPAADREAAALKDWQSAVGAPFATADAATLLRYSAATFAISRRIVAVLRPGSVDEVATCVRIAGRHGVPLYPISGGRNWGLGSRVPASDGNAVLDLGRLKRISDFDERLGHVRIEAGVTFRELHEFLAARGSELYLPAIGGPADASIIGNCVERGDATGPHADRLANLCDLDVILANGDRLRTGFGRFPGSVLAPLSNRPPGPQLDGLFSQSNLGIVLVATVWLARRPAVLQLFTGRVPARDELPMLIDALQPLIMRGVIAENSVSLWNAYKLLPRLGRYPWRLTGGATPLALRSRGQAEPWFVCGAIYSPSSAVASAQKELVEAAVAAHLLSFGVSSSESDPTVWSKAGLFVGVPTDDNTATVYWRKREPRPARIDPDADRCGVLWICLALPFVGDLVGSAVARLEDLALAGGFEPIIGFECTSARVLHAFVALYYDRGVDGEDERARAGHDAVLSAAADLGIHPYRLGHLSADRLGDGEKGYGRAVRSIKAAFDPDRIFAPGRYDFDFPK